MTSQASARLASASRAATAGRLERASGRLATAVTERLDERLEWFRSLPARERSWVGLISQAGIAGVIAWYRDGAGRPADAIDVFSSAPRELARAISLEQTVEMVRCTVDLLEELLPEIAGESASADVREAVLTYSREIAFAAAEVYARAAEARGAWDARLEALVMESLLRGEPDAAALARATALGWSARDGITVLVGPPPDGDAGAALQVMRLAAAHHGLDLLTALHGEALVAVVGHSPDDDRTARLLSPHFGAGPLVVGPHATAVVDVASASAEALAAYDAAAGWPGAPRPVHADDLLPERALGGDQVAARRLVDDIVSRLRDTDPELLRTLAAFLETAPTLEATARELFVHTNTVRHRLRRIEAVTGRSPTDPRDALTLRLALVLSRL